MLTEAERKQKAKTRSAMALMGVGPAVNVTRLDLAIRAKNKLFMAHRATQEFLDHMWSQRSGNGEWLDTVFSTSPKFKFFANAIGYVAGVVLYTTMYVTMPHASQMALPSNVEWCWWCW